MGAVAMGKSHQSPVVVDLGLTFSTEAARMEAEVMVEVDMEATTARLMMLRLHLELPQSSQLPLQ